MPDFVQAKPSAAARPTGSAPQRASRGMDTIRAASESITTTAAKASSTITRTTSADAGSGGADGESNADAPSAPRSRLFSDEEDSEREYASPTPRPLSRSSEMTTHSNAFSEESSPTHRAESTDLKRPSPTASPTHRAESTNLKRPSPTASPEPEAKRLRETPSDVVDQQSAPLPPPDSALDGDHVMAEVSAAKEASSVTTRDMDEASSDGSVEVMVIEDDDDTDDDDDDE